MTAPAVRSACPCGSLRSYPECCGHGDPRNLDIESAYAESIRHHQAGRVADALHGYRRVLERAPDHPGALYFLGAALLEAGNAAGARPYLVRAMELQPARDANAYYALGLAAHVTGDYPAAETAYRRALSLQPDFAEVRNNLAVVLRKLGRVDEAMREIEAVPETAPANAIQILNRANLLVDQGRTAEAIEYYQRLLHERPDDFAVLNNFGGLLNQLHRYDEGMDLLDRAESQLRLYGTDLYYNRGRALHGLGRFDEAAAAYARALEFNPRHFAVYSAWARLEEERHALDRAAELARQALDVAPRHPEAIPAAVILSKFQRRRGDLAAALAQLQTIDLAEARPGVRANYYFELGTVLDALGRYDAAIEAYAQANADSLAQRRVRYEPERHRDLADRLARFFTRQRVAAMQQLSPPPDAGRPRPIFIVGFPRSGTTLVEQVLGAHPLVHAGDELPYLPELVSGAARELRSTLGYPECLADAARPENHLVFGLFRNQYLGRAERAGVAVPGVPWFTDKMPLNEWHLGLISLLFPDVAIVHVVRHPLDACLSSYFQELTHGGYCSYELGTVAQHYALTHRLVEHYRAQLPLRYLRVRYEDLVTDFERHVRRLLEFVGAPFDDRCLRFHESERVARTASYAQVNQPLYTGSLYRYTRYRRHVEPMLAELAPVIAELGYTVQD